MSRVACHEVRFRYRGGRRGRVALAGVDFHADGGDIVGVVGPNGAGKTTLLALVAGALVPDAGTVTVSGRSAASRMARRMVGYATDPPLIPPELTGREWLRYLAAHRAAGAPDVERLTRAAIETGQLDQVAGRRVGTYSRGTAQRLALAGAALLGPAVLVLDETLGGIDPLAARRLRATLAALAAEGRTVIVASHDLGVVERLATRVAVLHRGQVVADVATRQLLRERVAELALNGGALRAATWLLARFPGAARTGEGVAVPLAGGLTVEQVLTACRHQRIAVAASRVRYRALEDVLAQAVDRADGVGWS